MKTKRVLILAVLAIVIIGISIGLYMFYKPSKTYERVDPDFYLSVEQLIEDFKNDEQIANHTYLDKIIQIEGKVVSVSTANHGKGYVSFIDQMDGLTCTFDSIQSSFLNNVQPGDMLTIKGRCDGKLTDVRLSKCILIK